MIAAAAIHQHSHHHHHHRWLTESCIRCYFCHSSFCFFLHLLLVSCKPNITENGMTMTICVHAHCTCTCTHPIHIYFFFSFARLFLTAIIVLFCARFVICCLSCCGIYTVLLCYFWPLLCANIHMTISSTAILVNLQWSIANIKWNPIFLSSTISL